VNAVRVRGHLASHWRVWLLIAVIVLAVNEVVDRTFFDHREHIDGDIVLTILILTIAFAASYAIVRLKTRRAAAG
jgi:hypothetical protein